MDARSLVRRCAALLVVSCLSASSARPIASAAHIDRGRELFAKIWEAGGTPSTRDGLGPMYNERSCIGCHFLGGVGGAGPNPNNVELLSLSPSAGEKLQGVLSRAIQLHPAFNQGANVVLHRFSTDHQYADFRLGILGLNPPDDNNADRFLRAAQKKQGDGPVKRIVTKDRDELLLSQRNTTPMFGAGIIDAIPISVLEQVARNQSDENPNVTGRLLGRFGWRGQIGTLKDFVLGACAVELGLEVRGHSQAANPLGPAVPVRDRIRTQPQETDLSVEDCEDLIAYIASLPPPRRLPPANMQEAMFVKNGEALFDTIGCALCHQPRLGSVNGIYSDLLVHEMGSLLDDPSPAPAAPPVSSGSTTPQYYSTVDLQSLLAEDRRREWKTPPLWGLADSSPYLHDGRAPTVEKAILWHGGEASSAVDRYRSLPRTERQRILLFLSKLAAPAPTKVEPTAVARRR